MGCATVWTLALDGDGLHSEALVLRRSGPYLRAAFAGTTAVGLTGALSPLVSALTLIDERAPDGLIHFWADSILKASGVVTEARGLENLPASNFVMCLNHQSNVDVLVLFRHVRRHMRFVAKAQLRRVPVFGYALERAGNIFVDRTGAESDRERLFRVAKAVRERVSVIFFAEGTRSEHGELMPFKRGAAIMALEAQVPLVPAAVAGTHRILEKGTAAIHARPAAIVIGQPIQTAGMSVEARSELTEQAHAEVARLLEQANAVVRGLERA